MKIKSIVIIIGLLCHFALPVLSQKPTSGTSVYTLRPEDPSATYFTAASDGKTDISDALQQTINDIKTKNNFGILFIPEGKYLIRKTIYIPQAIRLIGYGPKRPIFILGASTPGFQSADSTDKGQAHYMFWFTSRPPTPGAPIPDAGAGTFYSALSNVDLRIEDGNPAAVALRTHFAQHSFISHVDIYIGNGKAGLFDVGNEMEDVRFFGGDYGIYTTKPSPGWQFMMVDTRFEGQRKAAIRTREAGLTIVRLQAKNVPAVIDIDSNYHEKLFMEDCTFDNITGPAIRISNEATSLLQINLRNIACRNTPILTLDKTSRKQITAPAQNPAASTRGKAAPLYTVKTLTAGLQIQSWSAEPAYRTTSDLQPLTTFPSSLPSDIPVLPSMSTWTNLKNLGAKGDGETDDTKIIQDAIDQYPTIYVPQGWYRITNTLKLKPNTILIGLNPIATQFQLPENTPAFGGFGSPVPLIETSRGGNAILTGIGLSTGASNPRAVACKWMAGASSYLNDVKFIGGHGTMFRPNTQPTAATTQPPNQNRNNQSEKDWDTQYWSLWITENGGGTFKDIWSASTYGTAGAYISNTSTPGRIYAMSIEHHVRNEVRFNKVANWKIYAMQLEEESRESTECQPMEIQDCHDLTFANLYMFRVIRVIKPYPYSVRLWGNNDHLEFLNLHNYSQIKYTTTSPIYDINTNTEVRPWEFARLYIDSTRAPKPATLTPTASAPTPTSNRLATGFEFAQSATADSRGNIYFCESRMRRIYRWSPATRTTTMIADYPWEPLSLSCDTKDNLLVVFKYTPKPGWLVDGKQEAFTNPPDAAGTSFSAWGNSGFATWVYSIDPENPDASIKLLPKIPISHPEKILYPAHRWRDFHDFNTVTINKPELCWGAPDGVTIIPIVYDLARSTSLAAACPRKPLYATDEYDKRTVRFDVSAEGYLSNPTYFAEHGEFSNAVDDKGNVFIADGCIYRFNPEGHQTLYINTPERPTSLTFGKDNKTLYFTSHQSLYEILAIP